jgi:DNA repair exonuclease SbcCD nuclease subunit
MVRFLHTGDWQLGMTRHYLPSEAQARFTQDRFDAVRRMLASAQSAGCLFAVVAGDVFESNHVDRRTVVRGLEAMGESDLPVFLLPGNHDPLDASSVYLSPTFAQSAPPNVRVLTDARPHDLGQGVEVVGAPWRSKRPLADLVGPALGACEPLRAPADPDGPRIRIGVAHGALDTVTAVRDDPARISFDVVRQLFEERRLSYLALGDRHSLTRCEEGNRMWYAGSPEPTDHDEEDPGKALVVDLEPDSVHVSQLEVGTWRFLKQAFELHSTDDVESLGRWLEQVPDKERTVLRLPLEGSLRLQDKARLDRLVEEAQDLFATVEVWGRQRDLAVEPEDADFDDLALAGFARETVEGLRAQAARDDEEGFDARNALALLVRLARKAS